MLAVSPRTGSPVADLYAATSHVVGQREARKRLAVVLRRQQLVRDGTLSDSPGVLVLGPTGTGKTLTIRAMCQASELPFAEANATQYTETGYVGADLSQMFLPLITEAIAEQLQQRRFDRIASGERVELDRIESITKLPDEVLEPAIEKAQGGVIFLDEFDKWLLQREDAAGRNPGKVLMAELLKFIEGSIVNVRDNEEDLGLAFNTDKVLIICAGAFVGIRGIIARRLDRDNELPIGSEWNMVGPADLVKFGLMPELVGRLSTVIAMKPLTENHLAKVITEDGGLVQEFVDRFASEDCELVCPPEALAAVGRVALGRNTGARGLRQVLEQMLAEAMFEASTHDGPGRVVLDAQAVSQERAVHVAL